MTPRPIREDVITLRPSIWKGGLLFLGSVAFVATGIFIVLDGDWRGWFVVGFFGLCLMVAVGMMLPGATSLTISRHGIEIVNLYKKEQIEWDAIDSFFVCRVSTGRATTKMIGVNYAASYRGQRTGRKIASALTGGLEGAIPNHFKISDAELCKLLNSAKQRWNNAA